MIVVTGTKRSGTSMWMQVLKEAGVQTIGQAYPKVWAETIKDGNKRGFFESNYRRGIYYATNPHPKTGQWLPPKKTARIGVKVFIPGVVRSDVVYLSRVIASVRPFRQYAASRDRLYDMERTSHEERGSKRPPAAHLDATLEWWVENFLLLRDITTRRYPVRLVSYESMLEDPEAVCTGIFNWLEIGDPIAAQKAVHPEDRTQSEASAPPVSHPQEEVFDEYHHLVKTGQPFTKTFLEKVNETHRILLPEIESALDTLTEKRIERQAAMEALAREKADLTRDEPKPKRAGSLNLDRLDALLHPAGERDFAQDD